MLQFHTPLMGELIMLTHKTFTLSTTATTYTYDVSFNWPRCDDKIRNIFVTTPVRYFKTYH
jgi:hypothetical protein